MYCSIFPSGMVIVMSPMTTPPARMREERIAMPPRK
jgi:hypothetical protein